MIRAIFWDFFGVINIDGKLNPEVVDFIDINKGKYRFAILSASNIDLHPWLQQNGVDDKFDFVQTTKEESLTKMDIEFYKRAIKKIKLKASEVLFVDDIESYLEVASSLGIITLEYNFGIKLDKQIEHLL
jgi:HAD superfamily hydrolase (TIGR01509 family)